VIRIDCSQVCQKLLPSVALVLWRPCVAYLLIVSAIAVPALAALLAA
jgi:hypothetical protein